MKIMIVLWLVAGTAEASESGIGSLFIKMI